MKFTHGALLVGALGAGGWYLMEKYDKTFPICFREPSWDHCLPDWNPGGFGSPFKPDSPYTARVDGGITNVKTLPLRVPLFERQVEFDPLEIKKDGDTKYEEVGAFAVSTGLQGRLMTIDQGEGPDRLVYVVAVDDNETEDPTDDRIVPIDLNEFDMFTEQGSHTRTFDDSLVDEYNTCKQELEAGNPNSQGCILSGVNGHDDNIPATVLDNIRAQHIAYDGCVVDTMAISSNVLLGSHTDVNNWDHVIDKSTVTIGDVAALSLKQRVASMEGVTEGQVMVYMATDEFGNAMQWEPGDRVDLGAVEHLSKGKYKAPDVYVPSFCWGGSFPIDQTMEQATKYIKGKFGEGDITDPKYLEQFNLFSSATLPPEIANGVFTADGKFIDGVTQKAVTVVRD
jgi:hypothetical protein